MTKYELHITSECKQNLKLCKKRGLPMQEPHNRKMLFNNPIYLN